MAFARCKYLAQCKKDDYFAIIAKHCPSMGGKFCVRFEPFTNADRIRQMSDAELAQFLAERSVNKSTVQLLDKNNDLTVVQIEELRNSIYCALMQWLKHPAEE